MLPDIRYFQFSHGLKIGSKKDVRQWETDERRKNVYLDTLYFIIAVTTIKMAHSILNFRHQNYSVNGAFYY